MKYCAGLDVSVKTTSICIVNQEKKIVFESEVPKIVFGSDKVSRKPFLYFLASTNSRIQRQVKKKTVRMAPDN
jgi:hypothetical protein